MANQFDDYELDATEREIEKAIAADQRIKQRKYARAAQTVIDQGVSEACTEAGLNPAQFQELIMTNPDVALKVQQKQAKKFASKIIENVAAVRGVTRDPQTGKWVKAEAKQQEGGRQAPLGKDPKSLQEAARAGKLSSDKYLERLVDAFDFGGMFRRDLGQR